MSVVVTIVKGLKSLKQGSTKCGCGSYCSGCSGGSCCSSKEEQAIVNKIKNS